MTAALALTLAYLASVVVRSAVAYRRLQNPHLDWVGNVMRADGELGYSGVARGLGGRRLEPGADFEVHFDALGCRIPTSKQVTFGDDASGAASALTTNPSGCILALGCSFTFGDACASEDTFVEQFSSRAGLPAVNGGLPGFGFTQMVLRARELIPRVRPSIVVLQWSPWLADRAVSRFAPTYLGRIPIPYVVERVGGRPQIVRPSYTTLLPQLPVADATSPPHGLARELRFFWRVGLPLFLHDDSHELVSLGTGLAEGTALDPRAAADWAGAEIEALCQQHGAQLVVLYVGSLPANGGERLEWHGSNKAVIVAGDRVLEAVCVKSDFDRLRVFGHWRGVPARPVDNHPNAVAHALLADALAEHLALPSERRLVRPTLSEGLAFDDQLGWVYAPGSQMTQWYPDNPRGYFHERHADRSTTENVPLPADTPSTINAAHGFAIDYAFDARGVRRLSSADTAAAIPAGARRIVCLGDGSTMGIGVHAEDTFSARLSTLLNAKSDPGAVGAPWHVEAWAQSGFTLRQQRAFLEREGATARPDLVIVALTAADQQDFHDRPELGHYDTRGMRTLQLVLPAEATNRFWAAGGPVPDEASWRAELERMRSLCEAWGTRLVLLRWEFDNWPAQFTSMIDGLCRDFESRGAAYLDLRPTLRGGHSAAALRVHACDRHAGPLAHRLTAEALAEFLKARGLLERTAR